MRRPAKVTCAINDELLAELRAVGAREDRSLSWLVEQAVAYWLARRVRGRPPEARLAPETVEALAGEAR